VQISKSTENYNTVGPQLSRASVHFIIAPTKVNSNCLFLKNFFLLTALYEELKDLGDHHIALGLHLEVKTVYYGFQPKLVTGFYF